MKIIQVLNCRYNDSVEDWILDNMIQQTMKPYFEWQSQNPEVDVTFMKHWGVADYYPKVEVNAEFKDETDSAFFVTSFPSLPQESLVSASFYSK